MGVICFLWTQKKIGAAVPCLFRCGLGLIMVGLVVGGGICCIWLSWVCVDQVLWWGYRLVGLG